MSERPTYYAWLRDDGTVDYSDLCAMVLPGNGGVYQIPVQVADLSKEERVVSAEEMTALLNEAYSVGYGDAVLEHVDGFPAEWGEDRLLTSEFAQHILARLTEGRGG